jgi:hypothetical protein
MGATMMGKHSPKVLDKRVKRKIFGSRMEVVTGKWTILNKEEMYCVYPHQIIPWRLDQGG